VGSPVVKKISLKAAHSSEVLVLQHPRNGVIESKHPVLLRKISVVTGYKGWRMLGEN
jgi:hypothetical protein